jgi:hypothetical protein
MIVDISMIIRCDTENQDIYLRESIKKIIKGKYKETDLKLVCNTFRSRFDVHNMSVVEIKY